MSEFGLCRVRVSTVYIEIASVNPDMCFRDLQFQFRLKALEGQIPGVKKASW